MSNTARSDDRRVHVAFGLVSAATSASIPLVPVPYYATVASSVLCVVVLLWLAYSLRQ